MHESVLITGAGSGIGLASCLALAERGFRVFATIPSEDQAPAVHDAATQHGVSVRILPMDVTDSDSIQAAVEDVISEAGSLYGLVNSAGLGMRGFFEDLSEPEIRRVYDVNVFGTMSVVRAVLPHMREAGRGRIVLITSAGGRIATMTISAYGSGKFALEGFGESLAAEVRPFGIHVSLVEPGLVMTPHFTRHRGRATAAIRPDSPYYAWFLQHEHLVDGILAKRRIAPDDVGSTVARALTAKRPRLRYPVGAGTRIMFALRRYLPERWFESLYSAHIIRAVTRPRRPATTLSNLESAAANPPPRPPTP